MSSLNTSQDGPSISKSYQTVVSAALPGGAAAQSPTYGQWAVYSVSAPLANAFQSDTSKESVLKVQSTGEGELIDMIDEFSDGKIQFAFAKVKDPNTTLPKSVLIAWCGEGVPERTKGYFGSHLAAVSSLLHGYHIQLTARNDTDLTPESIIRRVADSSGSKYSGDTTASIAASKPPPPVASKPVFTPTQVGGVGRGFNPLAARTAGRPVAAPARDVDADGWGADAPQVTRTQLEKVAPAYTPTRVDMASLTSSQPEASRFQAAQPSSFDRPDVVRGAYQPIGKVDIAEIRRQAQESGNLKDDRPTAVKGSYEPIGKVDIAAIRARAQPSAADGTGAPPPAAISPAQTGFSDQEPKSLADRSVAFNQSERLTSLPKPKVAGRFGGSSGSSFAGTKAPLPGGFDGKPAPSTKPTGLASKNFADEGGKTPAQLWAEKKARQGGSVPAASASLGTTPVDNSSSDGPGQWQSGYTGKKWGAVQTTRTGQSAGSVEHETPAEQDDEEAPHADVSAIRDRFKNAAPISAVPPPMNMSSKPNAGAGLPPPPAQPPRTPTPEMRSSSPVRIAMPVSRTQETTLEPPEERFSPPPMPTQSLAAAVPHEDELDHDPATSLADPARGAGEMAAATSLGAVAVAGADPGAHVGGKRALVQYDYEKAEDNELELVEGEYVTNIEMVDEDWWLGENSKGERGLFPSNYVEIVEEDEHASHAAAPVAHQAAAEPVPAAPAAHHEGSGKPTATAQFEYEAAEENELSFPEGAKITDLEFPDEDWWLGEYNGKKGLFPGNYVELDPQ